MKIAVATDRESDGKLRDRLRLWGRGTLWVISSVWVLSYSFSIMTNTGKGLVWDHFDDPSSRMRVMLGAMVVSVLFVSWISKQISNRLSWSIFGSIIFVLFLLAFLDWAS